MNVRDIMNIMKFQPPQVVGNMTVIPITSVAPLEGLSSEMLIQITSDTDYSRLVLKNIDDKPVIVPSGLRFSSKTGQDRVVKSTSVIEPDTEEDMDVGCIEPSESSHIPEQQGDFSFVPVRLRIPTLDKRSDQSCSTIWEDIKTYLSDAGVGGDSVRHFFKTFEKELDDFVAQFEPVPNQIGAAVLLNNQLVGIEVYPNHGAWLKVWRLLIRDSYGADALVLIKKRNIIAFKPTINLDKIHSFADLKAEVVQVKVDLSSNIVKIMDEILEKQVTTDEPSLSAGYEVSTVQAGGFTGQLVTKDQKLAYFSLLRR